MENLIETYEEYQLRQMEQHREEEEEEQEQQVPLLKVTQESGGLQEDVVTSLAIGLATQDSLGGCLIGPQRRPQSLATGFAPPEVIRGGGGGGVGGGGAIVTVNGSGACTIEPPPPPLSFRGRLRRHRRMASQCLASRCLLFQALGCFFVLCLPGNIVTFLAIRNGQALKENSTAADP